jgi:macrolide transport system ATP-binding/permease protein
VPEPVIEVRGVSKTYHMGDVEVQALRGVDLVVERGDFLAVMGASGSGKSTLMNVLGCLDRPTEGTYHLEGVDVTSLGETALASIRSHRIGFVFQSFNLLKRTSARENVALPLFYAGDPDDGAARADAALRALGLAGREANHPSQLSGGEQQRVAIARALINRPAILLADEPTGNLDSKNKHEIMSILQGLNRDQGITIVLVTHETDIAAYAQRTITMRDGQIVEDSRAASAPAIAPRAEPPPAAPLPAEIPSDALRALSFLRMAFAVSGRAIARNKLRSALTMLGIFIGVAALIAMVAVGQGADRAVRAQIESLGTNLLIVLPGATQSGGVRGGFGSASTLTVADANAIAKDAPAVANVGYLLQQPGQVQYANKNWNTTVTGITPSYLTIRTWPLDAGRVIVADDVARASRVCLIGQTVYSNLFGSSEDPVGATILVKGVALQVVGLLSTRGQSGMGRDQDDVVLIPFSTAERKVLGVAAPTQTQTTAAAGTVYPAPVNPFGMRPKLTGFVNSIFVQAHSTDTVPAALDQVKKLLTQRHLIAEGQIPDFDVRNISDVTQAREGSSRIMKFLLAAVASISLLVGGIGIMNILLVSVTERTREIGIRLAIGARRIHVLMQFLVEAVLLSGIGGLAGVLVGIVISKSISWIAGWPTLLPWPAIVGGFLFSAAVGVFFGYYPARRASLLDPIEALRYE